MIAWAFATHGLGIAALIAAKLLPRWGGAGARGMRAFLFHTATLVRRGFGFKSSEE
jgi:hypothetical protein